MNRQKLRKILGVLDPTTKIDFTSFDNDINSLKQTLKQRIQPANFDPLVSSFNKLKGSFEQRNTELNNLISGKQKELLDLINSSSQESDEKINTLNAELVILQAKQIPDYEKQIKNSELKLETVISGIQNSLEQKQELDNQKIQLQFVAFEQAIKDLKLQFQKHGGGSMNRKISVNGVVISTRYTDINFKAGANVTFTKADNNITHQVDFTIASTGGGGGATWTAGSFTVDGVTTVFTLPLAATSYASVFLHINGQFLSDQNLLASGYDYTLAGDNITITMVTAPLSSDKFIYNFS